MGGNKRKVTLKDAMGYIREVAGFALKIMIGNVKLNNYQLVFHCAVVKL